MKIRSLISLFFLAAPGLPAQSPEQGLVLHFSAKAPGQDLSGQHNDGDWRNVSLAAGIPGISDSSLYFNGLDSYIEVPATLSLDRNESMTISIWCKLELPPPTNTVEHLVSRRFPSITPLMSLFINSVQATFSQTNGEKTVFLGLPVSFFFQKNTWYHIVGVFDRGKKEMCLYLNGELISSGRADFALAVPKAVPLHIGCDMRNHSIREKFFKGSMEDIRLYNRALNDSEVRALTKGFVFSKPEDAFKKMERPEAGRYILAQFDSRGKRQGPPEVVDVTAEEPFWKNGWFVAGSLAGTFLLTFLIAFLYNRYRQQKQAFEFEKRQLLERERFRIAREMHDDIGSGLSAINLLTEIALNKSKDPQLAAEIERIAAAAREVHSRIQDIIWSISTQNDTLAGLFQHLQKVATEMLAPSGIVLQVAIPAQFPATEIPGNRRRALFLAFKEALHNIVKHARATQVEIGFAFTGKQLSIRLRDDGRGFDPSKVNDLGNGLMNMRRRMEEAGGAFRVESGRSGTEVVFGMPV